jgi:hypothetical protein
MAPVAGEVVRSRAGGEEDVEDAGEIVRSRAVEMGGAGVVFEVEGELERAAERREEAMEEGGEIGRGGTGRSWKGEREERE